MAGSDGYLRPVLVGCCGNCLEVFVSKETGGPAFPYSGIHKGDDASYIIDSHGMTLRDHFAGQALPDLIAGYSRNQGSGPYLDASPDEIAYWAYRYADAMLKARSSTE